MSAIDLKIKLAALRRSVACEYYPDKCNEILGLGKVAAGAAITGATAITVKKAAQITARLGSSIRNPQAKICSISRVAPDFLRMMMEWTVLKTAYAASNCSPNIHFLNQDLDRTILEHTSDLRSTLAKQKEEIKKLSDLQSETRSQLAKELGLSTSASEKKLLQEAQVRMHRHSTQPARPVPSLSADDLHKKKLVRDARMARIEALSSPPGSEAHIRHAKAEEELLKAFNNNRNSLVEFVNRKTPAPQPLSQSSPNTDKIKNLAAKLDKISEAQNKMASNQSFISKKMLDWEFFKSKQGLPKDLASASQLYLKLFNSGANVASVEGRLTALEARAGIREGVSAWKVARAGAKTIAKVGVITVAGAFGGAAMAADFVSSSATACGLTTPSFLKRDKDCNLDYSITKNNVDVVFSDVLGDAIMNSGPADKATYMCFIKANWQKRFGVWKTICQPGPKDFGKFQNKIYAKRADGKEIYFQNSANPAAIYGSISDSSFLAQAYEISSCCRDSNPRITNNECALYGIKMNTLNSPSSNGRTLQPSSRNGTR